MRLPRNLSGDELIKKLKIFGYEATRQTGSHIRLTRATDTNSQHITIPRHHSLRVGTLNSILKEVAHQLEIVKEDLLDQLF